jgi:hypothetical protein
MELCVKKRYPLPTGLYLTTNTHATGLWIAFPYPMLLPTTLPTTDSDSCKYQVSHGYRLRVRGETGELPVTSETKERIRAVEKQFLN